MAHNYNKIILNLMVKNESRIIERCIACALEYVDAIFILDTGSTDNTVVVSDNFLKKFALPDGKPYKISIEPFNNFGYNRTISFKKAKEFCKELKWDCNSTYILSIDADMIIRPSSNFKNFKMSLPGYQIMQDNGTLQYFNTRLMGAFYNWTCVGATHEYWDSIGYDDSNNMPNKIPVLERIPSELIYIRDLNDGGCKESKFKRDIILLLEDLKKDENNERTNFYLAQSYKDSANFRDAIKYYKKRIKLGGWNEEVWYSHYMIGKCYESLNQSDKMELWMNRAFKFYPVRAEPIYYLVKYFRMHREYFKAYHYYLKGHKIQFPQNDILFVEYSVYSGLFDYENIFISSYIFTKSKQDSLIELINYINTKIYHINEVYDNIWFYVDSLVSNIYNGEYRKFNIPAMNEFRPSSCSILCINDNFIMNIRLVNYLIDSTGNYSITSSSDNCIRTINANTILNISYYPIQDAIIMNEEIPNTYPNNIEGLEDIRLFSYNGAIRFIASSKNVTDDDNIVIVCGDYDIDKGCICNISVIDSPYSSICEKNWIYIPTEYICNNEYLGNKMNFIYRWYPFEIGAVNSDNKLEIHTVINTPQFFSRLRGSSNICKYKNNLLCVVHFVINTIPRKYIHLVVSLNCTTMRPESYSIPFIFRKCGIEYCLGFHIKNEVACFIFSQNDSEPGFITMPIDNLKFVNIA